MSITAADFEMKYDEEHTYPFFEDDDGRILGYGHPDKARAADQVTAYYAHTARITDDPCRAEDVVYRWAIEVDVPVAPGDEPGAFVWAVPDAVTGDPVPVTADFPGAFPVWTVTL